MKRGQRLSLRVKAVEDEEKKAVGRWKVGEGKKVTPWREERKLLSGRYCSFLFSLMFPYFSNIYVICCWVHSRVWSLSTHKSYHSHLGLHFSISITTSILCSMSLLRSHSPPTHPAQHPNIPTPPCAFLTYILNPVQIWPFDPGKPGQMVTMREREGVARSRQEERKRERESGRWER